MNSEAEQLMCQLGSTPDGVDSNAGRIGIRILMHRTRHHEPYVKGSDIYQWMNNITISEKELDEDRNEVRRRVENALLPDHILGDAIDADHPFVTEIQPDGSLKFTPQLAADRRLFGVYKKLLQ